MSRDAALVSASAYERSHIRNAIRLDWTTDLQDRVLECRTRR